MRATGRRLAAMGLGLVGILAWAAGTYGLDQNLDVTGDVRLRLRHVDSPDTGDLAGTYGELVKQGLSLKHRFVLEVAYPLTDQVRAGGMLRVSNEGSAVLEAGPDYLSSEFGSAFIAYESPAVRTRLGYYTTAYTPLTLMRWDTKDDPEGGSGCGCPGAGGGAGAILGETLEELGPNLTFEGARVSLTPKGTFGLDGFLARPRQGGENYQIITYGGRAGLITYLKSKASFLDVGLVAVRSEEDEHSLDATASAGLAFKKTVYGISWKAPLARTVSLDGEWTLTKSSGDVKKEGRGGMVSLAVKPHAAVRVEAAYLYLSPNWDSYFRALSYNPDRQGVRLRLEVERGPALVALFARYLSTIEAASEPGGGKTAYPTLSVRGRLKVSPAVSCGIAAIYSGKGNADDGVTLDAATKRITAIGTLIFEFAGNSALTLEERYIWNRVDEPAAADRDYEVSMLSLYVRAGIW
jgi:hypothetical protein